MWCSRVADNLAPYEAPWLTVKPSKVRPMTSIAEAFNLTDRVAIVTGAGRGLGRAIATRLAEAGATVVCADIDDTTAAETAAAIGLDHQLGFWRDRHAHALADLLLGREGRGRAALAHVGDGARTAARARQRDRAGLDRHADERAPRSSGRRHRRRGETRRLP